MSIESFTDPLNSEVGDKSKSSPITASLSPTIKKTDGPSMGKPKMSKIKDQNKICAGKFSRHLMTHYNLRCFCKRCGFSRGLVIHC